MANITPQENAAGANNRLNDLTRILCESGGMLGVKPKVKVVSKEYLGLVYTPGVGAVCKAIEADNSLGIKLTNKANSCVVLTDSSGFEGFDANTWVQEQAIPFLESKCVFHKTFLNIDAYPLLVDSKLTKDGQDLCYLLDNISPAYCAFQLHKVSKERETQLRAAFEQKKFESFIWTSEDGGYVCEVLGDLKIDSFVYQPMVVSAVIRVALDNQVHGFVCRDKLKAALTDYSKKVSEKTDELSLIVELITSLQAQFGGKPALRNSVEFVTYRYQYNGEKRPIDTHDYVKTERDASAIYIHDRFRGMIETYSKVRIQSIEHFKQMFSDKALAPISKTISEDPESADYLTLRRNYSAIATNGTAILGFGDIGALAGMPVMEGKCVLFKELGTVNMMPLCIKEKDADKFITVMQKISPIFTSVNLEDIKAPDCFKIEPALKKSCRAVFFHDDQHGTAIVCTAALFNYCKVTGKRMADLNIIINGGGAAGISICSLLLAAGAGHLIVCDTKGSIYKGRKENMNEQKNWIAENTNQKVVQGSLADVLKGADVFIGVSAPKVLTKDMVRTMAEKSFVLALANPVPEIYPEEANEGGAYCTATGRSDFVNQVNNSLAFPGLFKGVKIYRANAITEEMKMECAKGLAALVPADKLSPDFLIPEALNYEIPKLIAQRVGELAKQHNNIRPEAKNKFEFRSPEEFEL